MNLTISNQEAVSQNHEVLFFDDFDYKKLDLSKWNVEISGKASNDEEQAYIDSPETLFIERDIDANSNGVLVFQPRYQQGFITPQGKSFDFVSGRINTRNKFEFTTGCVSARILMSSGSGSWPAFWVLGSGGNWPGCGEIDVMENVGEPDWSSVAIHGPGYSGETPLVNKKFFPRGHFVDKWHVYSVEFTRTDSFIFRIDGELIYRVTRPMVEFYGPWVFDAPKFLIFNVAVGGTYPHKTNGARLPYYGIPEETVVDIQAGKVKMMVDWVKVEKAN